MSLDEAPEWRDDVIEVILREAPPSIPTRWLDDVISGVVVETPVVYCVSGHVQIVPSSQHYLEAYSKYRYKPWAVLI